MITLRTVKLEIVCPTDMSLRNDMDAKVAEAVAAAETYLDRQLAHIDTAISLYSNGRFVVRNPEAKS